MFQLYEVYKISFKSIHLENLNEDTLFELANKHDFVIPDDKNLKALILTPFYLREYLRHYQENKVASYFEFKESLWPRVISKRSPQREQFFIHLAEERANSGRFFVIPDASYSNETVEKSLVSDGIISYESTRGYFITHDIYEEWALDKFVESNFLSSENAELFFDRIQQSLPIRRVFRRWLSEKLSAANEEVSHLIVETLSSHEISNLWKDEVLVSMLLSDYSDYFFNVNKDSLLENDLRLLKRICLLIRIGCKEIDNSFFDRLGVRAPDILSMEYVITKPKGNGWKSLIKFIHDNLEKIGVNNLNFVLPVLYDWNCHNKSGDSTKHSSIIALSFYKSAIEDDVYIGDSDNDFSKNLILTILYGVGEIKKELEAIIDEIIINNWKEHNDPYHLMSEFILTRMECFNVAIEIPEKVIALSKFLWMYESPESDDYFHSSRLEIDHEFGIENRRQDYYPASAYQTPIYVLLQTNLELTLNFITELINYNSEKDKYLEYFTANFTLSEGMADLLNEFVSVEDSLNMPDSFWYVWRRFKGHIIDSISNQGWKHDKDRIIESFLFARVPWKDEAKTWHTFSPENRSFFSDLSGKIGGESSFIYSIGKLLCGIGSDFLDDGIYWISHSIKTFDIDLSQDKSGNTLFFLERYMRRYLFKNHDKVRRTPNLKAQSMVVLDFLVEQYSITGYLLREDIA